MKRVLITGMSGTGKSTVVRALAARGYRAVDLDCDDYSEWVVVTDDSQQPGTPVEPDKDWVWREERVQELLSTDDTKALFVSGCASNMGKFAVNDFVEPNETVSPFGRRASSVWRQSSVAIFKRKRYVE